MSNKTQLQTNNTKLTTLIQELASKAAGGSSEPINMVVRNIIIDSDMGNGTITTRTILTADEFVKAHYADDGFFAMLYPVTQIASAKNVVHWLHHGNFNTGSTNVTRYGICYYSSSASALAMRVMTWKINGNGYNVSLRAKSTGNMDLYCESGRIVKAGTYRLVMGCWS